MSAQMEPSLFLSKKGYVVLGSSLDDMPVYIDDKAGRAIAARSAGLPEAARALYVGGVADGVVALRKPAGSSVVAMFVGDPVDQAAVSKEAPDAAGEDWHVSSATSGGERTLRGRGVAYALYGEKGEAVAERAAALSPADRAVYLEGVADGLRAERRLNHRDGAMMMDDFMAAVERAYRGTDKEPLSPAPPGRDGAVIAAWLTEHLKAGGDYYRAAANELVKGDFEAVAAHLECRRRTFQNRRDAMDEVYIALADDLAGRRRPKKLPPLAKLPKATDGETAIALRLEGHSWQAISFAIEDWGGSVMSKRALQALMRRKTPVADLAAQMWQPGSNAVRLSATHDEDLRLLSEGRGAEASPWVLLLLGDFGWTAPQILVREGARTIAEAADLVSDDGRRPWQVGRATAERIRATARELGAAPAEEAAKPGPR